MRNIITLRRVLLAVLIIALAAVGITLYQGSVPARIEASPDWESSLAAFDIERESFFVENDGFRLEAELLIPNGGAEQKAAVIFSPGSGDSLYQNYGNGLTNVYINEIFLPRDMAVLYINKRGMGESEGNWVQSDFPGRADDIYAAVEALKENPAIDPDRIGLIGHSQGGWIVQLVAAEHPDVAFFISLAGPATSVEDQMMDIYTGGWGCEGYEGEDLAKKADNQMRLTRTGASIGRVVGVGVIGFDSRIIEYDPAEALRTVKSPGLLVFGENDILVPADQNIAQFKAIFEGSPPDNLRAVSIAGGTHRFQLVDGPCDYVNATKDTPFSEELVDVLNDWLTEIGY